MSNLLDNYSSRIAEDEVAYRVVFFGQGRFELDEVKGKVAVGGWTKLVDAVQWGIQNYMDDYDVRPPLVFYGKVSDFS